MSGISSIGSYNPDLYYQQLEQALSQQDAATADSNVQAASTAAAAVTSTTDTSSTSSAKSLQDQIRTAIMTAVQGAENTGANTDLLCESHSRGWLEW